MDAGAINGLVWRTLDAEPDIPSWVAGLAASAAEHAVDAVLKAALVGDEPQEWDEYLHGRDEPVRE